MKKPKIIDLFCGAGGLSEGFHSAGFETVFLNDIEKSALLTASKNHPKARTFLGGIEFLSKDQIELALGEESLKMDGIIGGPPCQGFSMANQQSRFIDNPKNHLFKHFVRLVWEIKPSFFLMENVEGLLNMAKGKIVTEIIKAFRDIGYEVDTNVLLATDFGVPQSRRRVVFIGNRIERKNVFPEKEVKKKKYLTVWDAISDLPEVPPGFKKEEIEYSKEPQSTYQKMLRGKASTVYNHITTCHSKKVLKRLKHIPPGGNWRDIPLRLLDDYKDVTRTHSSVYKRLSPEEPAITISNFRKSMILHPFQDRIISVREAARLQSFPDKYFFYGTINQKQQQVADAVPPVMGKAIAKTVLNEMLC